MAVGARDAGGLCLWPLDTTAGGTFCVDHLLMIEINCSKGSLIIDLVFPTTNVGDVGIGDNVQLGVTGTESVMQIVRDE
jgi:hypothetical protein